MESILCLLTEWTLKAGGYFEADSVILIKKGAFTVPNKYRASYGESLDMFQKVLLTPLWICGGRLW